MIRPGITAMADVLSTFGAPDRIVRHSAGDVFIYRFELHIDADLVVILFDSNDRVSHLGVRRAPHEN